MADKIEETLSKAVNFVGVAVVTLSAVNEFVVRVAEQYPTWAPVLGGILAGFSTPFLRFRALFGKK